MNFRGGLIRYRSSIYWIFVILNILGIATLAFSNWKFRAAEIAKIGIMDAQVGYTDNIFTDGITSIADATHYWIKFELPLIAVFLFLNVIWIKWLRNFSAPSFDSKDWSGKWILVAWIATLILDMASRAVLVYLLAVLLSPRLWSKLF